MRIRSLDAIEIQVLELFGNGKTTEEIGGLVNLHKGMVQHHLRMAVRKLGAANHVHAAVVATEMGLIRSHRRGI